MKNKNNIYVKVESKEQALRYRCILKLLGEPCALTFSFSEIDKYLLVNESTGNWLINKDISYLKNVTFGELIYLLQRKALIVSEDGVEIFEGDDFFIFDYDTGKFCDFRGKGYKATSFPLSGYDKQPAIFSSRESAIKWVEEHGPKEIIFEFGAYKFTVNKNSVNVSHSDSDTFIDIKSIYKAFEDFKKK